MDLGAAQMVVAMATGVLSAFTAALTLGWWLSGQFRKVGDLVQVTKDHLNEKLDQHETHDIERFDDVRTRLLRLEYNLPNVVLTPREH